MAESLRFDRFYPYEDLTRHLHALAGLRPDLVTVETIGKSYEGRDIWCATITDTATGPAREKPAVWIDGNIHATELSASSACLYFIKHLLDVVDSNAEVAACLATRAFYVVPRLNPDGAELYFADRPRFLRSSTRPYPYDEEPLDGLEVEDIDGDGRILTMRIEDPNGPWKAHPDEPRLMVRRDPTESGGAYYRLLPEGTIRDYDGVTLTMRPNKERLDLNRNFPAHWRQENEQHGAGPFPTSEPEVRALVAFVTSHPNITAGVAFHTYSGVLLRPYGTQNDESFPAEDLWTYKAIGARGTELTGYPNISVYHDFRYHPKEVITGVFDDWMYDHLGLFAWTVEIWSPQRQAGITDYKFIDWYRDHPVEDDLKMLAWSDEKLGGRGCVPWTPFDHPQLGRIEVGGWDTQLAFRNPPAEFLEEEIKRFPAWLLWHAQISPRLELHTAEAVRVGDGAYRVRLVVHNSGWLPSYVTKKAVEKQVARPVVAEIALPEGAALEVGKQRVEIGHLEGRAYTGASAIGWVADTTQDRGKVEWAVRGAPGQVVELVARQDRCGVVRAAVALP